MNVPRNTKKRKSVLFLAALLFMTATDLANAQPVSVKTGKKQETGIFKVHYKNIDDAYLLIRKAITPEGEIVVVPRLNTITVTDTPEIIKRIGEILEAFDTPPRTIEMEITVIKGEREPISGDLSRRNLIRGEARRLKELCDYLHFTPLDTIRTIATEGGKTTIEFPNAPNYKIEYTLNYVDVERSLISLKPFKLLVRETVADDAKERYKILTKSDEIVLLENEERLLGGSDSMTPNFALFFSFNASILRKGEKKGKE